MRVVLLATTLALLAASPAAAQCVYVACGGSVPNPTVYQQPTYQAPAAPAQNYGMPAPRAQSGYDEGYAAGLAARPSTSQARRTSTHRQTTSSAARRGASASTVSHRLRATVRTTAAKSTSHRVHTGGTTTQTRRTTAATSGVSRSRAVSTTRTRMTARAPARQVAMRSTGSNNLMHTHVGSSSHAHSGTYQDPIKDRASTYRPTSYGQATSMASMMSSSSRSSTSTTTWSGPATVVNQGGQVCGWGARIVTNSNGYAQRQAVWVCQCPQGWRPPGY
jgi:hypothetical protein